MIEVRPFTVQDTEAYQQFVRQEEQNLIYASLEYQSFLSAVVPGRSALLLALEGNRIIGSLPYFRIDVPGLGSVLNSLPWYGSHGGCTVTGEDAAAARRALLSRYREIVTEASVLSSTLILSFQEEGWRGEYLEMLQPLTMDGRIGQISELPLDGPDLEPRLERSYSQKTRNLVRKSLKQGFGVMATDEEWAWRFLAETHLHNMRALNGRPKPWQHFLALRTHIPNSHRALWVATLNQSPVAALLLLYFHRTVEYFVPAVVVDFRGRQPLSCLIYSAMRDAIRGGYKWWNWGGTWASQTTLHHFKAGWGARERPYSYLVNATPESMVVLKQNRDRLQRLFPYFYTHPYEVTK